MKRPVGIIRKQEDKFEGEVFGSNAKCYGLSFDEVKKKLGETVNSVQEDIFEGTREEVLAALKESDCKADQWFFLNKKAPKVKEDIPKEKPESLLADEPWEEPLKKSATEDSTLTDTTPTKTEQPTQKKSKGKKKKG